jgi:hypothetical protein
MAEICEECGATIPDGGTCQENLHALLFIESQIPGGPGGIPHFYAIAAYGLQHPDSMNYTAGTLAGLHTSLAEVLEGKVTIPELRRRTRQIADGSQRITRRPGEASVEWRRGDWPLSISHVLDVEPTAEAYAERVLEWARAVLEALDEFRK